MQMFYNRSITILLLVIAFILVDKGNDVLAEIENIPEIDHFNYCAKATGGHYVQYDYKRVQHRRN